MYVYIYIYIYVYIYNIYVYIYIYTYIILIYIYISGMFCNAIILTFIIIILFKCEFYVNVNSHNSSDILITQVNIPHELIFAFFFANSNTLMINYPYLCTRF